MAAYPMILQQSNQWKYFWRHLSIVLSALARSKLTFSQLVASCRVFFPLYFLFFYTLVRHKV